jgi:hypothetical protein
MKTDKEIVREAELKNIRREFKTQRDLLWWIIRQKNEQLKNEQ